MFFKNYVLNIISKDHLMESVSEYFNDAVVSLSEPKNVAIATLSVAGTLILIKFLFTQRSQVKPIPEFPGASTFSGHRALIEASSTEGQLLKDLNPGKYPLGYLRVAFLKVLMLCDLKVWKEVYMRNGMASSGRITGYPVHMDSHYKHAIAFTTGEPWKMSRRIFVNHLRQWGREKQFQLVLEEVGFFLEAIEKSPDSVEPSRLLAKVFCNVICTFIFGSRIEYSDPEIETILGCIDMFNLRNPVIPEILWPIFARFPILPSMRMRKRGIKQIKNYIKKKIEPLLSSGPRNPPETLVEAYALDIMEKGSGQLNIDSLIAICHELFFAGTETSSTTIQWFLAFMATHLEVQEKLFQEIQSVVGNGKLTPNHLKEMNYLPAVQFEVQRFGCIVQTVPPHMALEDIQLSTGEMIKKGQMITGGIHWVMHHKDFWKKPEKFYPENFLDDSGKFTTNEAFVPYGMGPRICLGQNLADLELKIAMCEIIRKFKITSLEDIDLEKKIQRATLSPQPYKYKFLAR